MRRIILNRLYPMCFVVLLLFLRLPVSAQALILDTGNIYYLGDPIPISTTSTATTFTYTLGFSFEDKDGLLAETYTNTGTISDIPDQGRVAFIPTSMLSKKGVYFLSASTLGISNRRLLLVDPLPTLTNAEDWPFGLIISSDKLNQGAAMAEEIYRMGIKFFHFDYPISTINAVGAGTTPPSLSSGIEAFINRAHELNIHPIVKLMSHYSQISGPTNLNGNFYSGLQAIQTHYQGKLKYWTISNEPEGGGYSQFTADQLALTLNNMATVLKDVDPNVKLLAGELYSTQYLDTLTAPANRDSWDILSSHNVIREDNGNAGVADYFTALGSVQKPIWDTESNGTMFGYPGEYGDQMCSFYPIDTGCTSDSAANTWGGAGKQLFRARCLNTLDGNTWRPGFYDPDSPCLGVDGYIAMHYNASWEQMWGVKTLRTFSADYPNTVNQKMAAFRQAFDTAYGLTGLTRIPNLSCSNPYSNCSPTAAYAREDGYIYRYGPEYVVIFWQNTGLANQDSEMVLQTNPNDTITLYDSLGRAVPLNNNNGTVKVWVSMDLHYLRGFSQLPTFARETTTTDDPYFVTQPVTQAVVGQPYYYQAWAYDSDKPGTSTDNSIPHLTYQLVTGPSGMTNNTQDDHSLLLSWTPTAAGAYPITLRATSAHGPTRTVDQTFTLTVSPSGTNLPPTFLSQPNSHFTAPGTVWFYNINAHDLNGDTITYSLAQAPSGMTIDPISGFVQWPNPTGQAAAVTLQATDSQGASAQQILNLNPGSATPPPISPTPQSTYDLDGDSDVDILDLLILISRFNLSGLGDFNLSGLVDIFDFNKLLEHR